MTGSPKPRVITLKTIAAAKRNSDEMIAAIAPASPVPVSSGQASVVAMLLTTRKRTSTTADTTVGTAMNQTGSQTGRKAK